MKSIGIVANPASGRDIRRLVSYATVIDNNEKVNISKRIVLAAQAMGIELVYFMPDTFRIGYRVEEELSIERVLTAKIEVADIKLSASASDSELAAAEMERLGAGCVVVLGGDGTCRAAAKGVKEVPLVPVSTGTNNVYPTMVEGTVAGMAAAAASLIGGHCCCIRDKRIELYINGEFRDSALIDAVLSDQIYAGSKAIWDIKSIRRLIVTRAHPASIGFSAIAGCAEIIRDTDDFGFTLAVAGDGADKARKIRAPVAAGVIEEIYIDDARIQPLGKPFAMTAETSGMVAVDGEREVKFTAGDELVFRIERNGPWRVKTREILELAKTLGYYGD